MSLFESYLSLGHGIDQGEKLALYKYLLVTKSAGYRNDAITLLQRGELIRYFANGEIKYFSADGRIRYIAREKNSPEFTSPVREI